MSGNRTQDLELDRRVQRLLVSPGAVVSVQQAAELLPIADRDARAWLKRKGLLRDLDGRKVVVWADVLKALEPSEDARPRAARLRREKL